MTSIDSDTSSPQDLDLGQLMASAATPSDVEAEAAIHAMVNPPTACPGCLARAGLPWPEGTTSRFCGTCADRMRRIHQCARWNANRDHQSAAGKARWVAAVARW